MRFERLRMLRPYSSAIGGGKSFPGGPTVVMRYVSVYMIERQLTNISRPYKSYAHGLSRT